jgi:hypothetical protein
MVGPGPTFHDFPQCGASKMRVVGPSPTMTKLASPMTKIVIIDYPWRGRQHCAARCVCARRDQDPCSRGTAFVQEADDSWPGIEPNQANTQRQCGATRDFMAVMQSRNRKHVTARKIGNDPDHFIRQTCDAEFARRVLHRSACNATLQRQFVG